MEKIVIQSDINKIVDVERFVYAICDTYNINNYAAIIVVSLLEAVKNAIVHGNNNDASKMVNISFDHIRGGVCFTITDEGRGFDYQSLLVSKSDVEQSNGFFLMKKLSDHISFSDNGSKVRLDFIINGIEASRALERISILKRHYSLKAVESW